MELGWFEVSLDVKDVARTCDFYANLGFEVVYRADRVATLQKADCRISLYQGYLDPPEMQLIFWQGDVEAITQDLASKGLRFDKGPSKGEDGGIGALLKDPDGRPIYFVNMPGVTKDGIEMSAIEVLSNVPVFSVADLRRSLAFYRDRLRFEVAFDIGTYAGVKRGGMELHLDGGAHDYSSRPTCCRFHIRGVDALYAEMEREDFIKPDERLATKHMRQFSVVDPDGNRITFAEPLQ